MSRKYGANLSEVSRLSGIPRSRFYRALSGETKNPSPETLQALQEAGVRRHVATSRVVPGNVWQFARDLTLGEVERLLNVALKPVTRMTQEELRHVYDSLQRFPGLYQWQADSREEDRG